MHKKIKLLEGDALPRETTEEEREEEGEGERGAGSSQNAATTTATPACTPTITGQPAAGFFFNYRAIQQ